MPFEIRRFKNGFKLCKVNSNKCFSKKPITKKQATKQMKAIQISESLKGKGATKSWFDKQKALGRLSQFKSFEDMQNQQKEMQQTAKENAIKYAEQAKEQLANVAPGDELVACKVKDDLTLGRNVVSKNKCKELHDARFLKWEAENYPDRAKFFRPLVEGLTKIGDYAVNELGDKVGLPSVVKDIYNTFSPSNFSGGSGINDEFTRNVTMVRDKNTGKFRRYTPQEWADLKVKDAKEKADKLLEKDRFPIYISRDGGKTKELYKYGYYSQLNGRTKEQYMRDEWEKEHPKPWGYDFFNPLMKGLTKATDFLVNETGIVPKFAKDVYNTLTPSTYRGGNKIDFKTYLKEVQKVSPIKYMKLVKENAIKNGYDAHKIKFSNDGIHKLEYEGVKFGALKYMDYILYQLKEGGEIAEKKRINYRKRSEKVMKESNNKLSKSSLSFYILW